MFRLLGITLIVVVIGVAVMFHSEIKDFSETFLAAKESRELVETGNWADAISVYEDQHKANPDNMDIALTLGDLYVRKGESEKALAIYRQLVTDHPTHVDTILAYGSLLQEDPTKRNKVLGMYRRVLKTHSDHANLLFRTGNVFQKAAENPNEVRPTVRQWLYDWAIYYYRLAIKANPNFYSPRFSLGVAYQQNNRIEKAANSYCNAIILSPDSFEARYNLGLALVDLQAYDEAYQQMGKAVQTLTDQGRSAEARILAERVQGVKNTVYNSESASNLGKADDGDDQLGVLLSPGCLVNTTLVN